MANDFSGDTNCVAVWNFESGAFTSDSKGSNTLTDNNTVSANTTDYKQGSQAADFESNANESFSVTDTNLDSGFPLKNGDTNKKISVCLWFRMESAQGTSQRTLVSKTDRNGKDSLELYTDVVSGNDEVHFWLGYNNGASVEDIQMISQASGFWATDTWYHIGFTYDDSTKGWTVKLHKEGDTNYTNSGTATNNINVEDGDFAIGGICVNGSISTANDWDGEMDEVVIFKDILTETEIDNIRDGTFGAAAETLTVSDVTCNTYVDSISLTQDHNLTVSDALSTTHISEITLSVISTNTLSVSDVTSKTYIESFSLIQEYTLGVPDVLATTHISEIALSVVAAGVETLTVADVTSNTYIEALSLTQEHNLFVSDISASTHIESFSLIQEYVLTVADVASLTYIESPTLVYGLTVTPSDITGITEIDAISLIQLHYLSVYGLAQQNYIESPTLSYSGTVFLDEVINPYLETTTTARELKPSTANREIRKT